MDNVISLVGSLDTQNKIWFKLFVKKELLVRRFNIIVQDEVDHQQLEEENKLEPNEESKLHHEGEKQKEQADLEANNIQEGNHNKLERGRLARYRNRVKGFTMKFKNLPSAVLFSFYHIFKTINYYIKVDKDNEKEKRIRYPRYFGYTKELETYSDIKAFAVDTMKTINYDLPYSENIISFCSLDNSEVILTENRLLCITRQKNPDMFDYWYLLFADILSCNIKREGDNKDGENDKDIKENKEESKETPIKTQFESIKAEFIDYQTPGSEPKTRNQEAKSNEEQRYMLTITHFSDYSNGQIIKKDDIQIKNFGLVDFKFYKKEIFGDHSELKIIHGIYKKIIKRIKRDQGERVL